MRAALYPRVSTEEQRRCGLSIGAQIESLTQYAKEHDMTVVGVYADEGVSARKPAGSRPALQRLLADVRAGRVDIVLFTKLDRWFRNVAEYYKVQEVLERHKVSWRAIHDDYDTTTASGRLKVNIMLSVAQDEADRTSERIKAVFEGKIRRQEPISGRAPFGYRIENKKLTPDPEAVPIVRDLFQKYLAYRSIGAVRKYANDAYGLTYTPTGMRLFLQNTRYIGHAHGCDTFCEGIVDEGTFALAQALMQERAQRNSYARSDRVYLFTSLVRCAECGNRLSAHIVRDKYIYYRCTRYDKYHLCPHKKRTSELVLEEWLLDNLLSCVAAYNAELSARARPRSNVDPAGIRRKMEKLKDLYLNDLISRDVYEQDYTSLRDTLHAAQLAELDAPAPVPIDPVQMRTALETYHTLSRLGQREFWSRVIKQIVVTNDETFSVVLNSPY